MLVWDLPLRLFHWALVVCLAGSWITAEAGFDYTELHFYFGYTSLGLIAFRLVWGFVGPRHARFSQFLRGPRAVSAHARSLLSREPSSTPGHTALGGWSAIVLVLLVGGQAVSGLFVSDDIFYAGPYHGAVSGGFADAAAGWHHTNFDVLVVIAAIHILAVLWYAWRKRQNLIGPMIHGRKPVAERDAIPHSRLVTGLLLAVTVGAAVWALVAFAPPPPIPDF